MNDDRLHRVLDAAARPLSPDSAFAAALLAELGDELGFVGSPRIGDAGRTRWPNHRRGTTAGRRRFGLLLVAAVVVGAAGGLVAAAGAIRERLDQRMSPSLLSDIHRSGHVRIAIRPDHPQFMLGGQTATGFDADVAVEIARRLGVTADIVIEDATTMTQAGHEATWDIALPSVPTWTIDPSRFLLTAPYYRWPHLLIVRSGSAATTVSDVAAGPICAVEGDSGEAWLTGEYGGTTSAPITTRVVLRPTDADCLAALGSGESIASVTAHLSAADVGALANLRVVGGPAAEPRAAIIDRQHVSNDDAAELLRAVNEAIAGMRADGTLTDRSRARFGGQDLTAP